MKLPNLILSTSKVEKKNLEKVYFRPANQSIVDDTVIFTAAKDLESIQRHLSEDCHNLSSWFRDNELVPNLKQGKTECMSFGTAKRLNALNGRQLALTVNGTLINTTSCYKYLGVNLDSSLNLESHCSIANVPPRLIV